MNRYHITFEDRQGHGYVKTWLELDAESEADAIVRGKKSHAARYQPSRSCSRVTGYDQSRWDNATARQLTPYEVALDAAYDAVVAAQQTIRDEWMAAGLNLPTHDAEKLAVRDALNAKRLVLEESRVALFGLRRDAR